MKCLKLTNTWTSGESAAKTFYIENVMGLTHTFVLKGTNTSGSITWSFSFQDQDGNELFAKSILVDDALYVYDPDAAENHEFPIFSGFKLVITPSANPGASQWIFTGYIYVV